MTREVLAPRRCRDAREERGHRRDLDGCADPVTARAGTDAPVHVGPERDARSTGRMPVLTLDLPRERAGKTQSSRLPEFTD